MATSTTQISYTVTGLNQIQAAIPIITNLSNANQALASSLQKLSRVAPNATARLGAFVNVFNSLNPALAGAPATVNNLTQAIANTSTAIHNATAATQGFNLSWISVSRIIMGSLISRGIGAVMRAITDGMADAKEFILRIGEIQTISQDMPKTFEQWAEQTRRLSAAWGKSGLEVLEAQYQILSNQIARGQYVEMFANDALRLSAITVSNAANSVEALTGVLNAYQLSAGNATYVSNILFKSVDLGRFRLDQIANSIGTVAVSANQLDISMEEMFASLTVLTRLGVSPNVALTQLRNLIMRLINPTENMKKLLDEWGVSSGKAAIESFGFIGVLEKLYTEGQKGNGVLEEMGDLFKGIRPVAGATGLVQMLNEVKNDLDQIKTSSNLANNAQNIMLDNSTTKLNQLTESIKNFFTIDIGANLQKFLTGITEKLLGIDAVTDAVKALTKALLFLGSAAVVSVVLSAIGRLKAALIGLYATMTAHPFVLAFMTAFALTVAMAGDSFAEVARLGTEAATRQSQLVLELQTKQAAEEIRLARDKANQISRIFLNRVANEMQAETMLKKLKEGQLTLEDMIFDMKMKVASAPEKEALAYQRLTALRIKMNQELAAQDYKNVVKTKQDIDSTYGLISALGKTSLAAMIKYGEYIDENGQKTIYYKQAAVNADYRAKQLMLGILGDVENVNKALLAQGDMRRVDFAAMEQIEKATRDRLKVIDELTAKQRNMNATIDDERAKISKVKAEMAGLLEAINQKNNMWLPGEITAYAAPWVDATGYAKIHQDMRDLDKLFQKVNGDASRLSKEKMAEAIALVTNVINAGEEKLGKDTFDLFTRFKAQLEALPSLKLDIGKLNQQSKTITDTLNLLKEQIKPVEEQLKNLQVGKTPDDINMNLIKINTSMSPILEPAVRLNELFKSWGTNIEGAAKELEKMRIPANPETGDWKGGYSRKRFATGGLASDIIPAYLSAGEFVMNRASAKKFLPQLVAMNSGVRNYSAGGNVTNVGDVNITVQGGNTSELTLRRIGDGLRRELKRKTIRLG